MKFYVPGLARNSRSAGCKSMLDPELEFSVVAPAESEVFHVFWSWWWWFSWCKWWLCKWLQRRRMVTMMTTVTKTRAVATPPKMLIIGWKLLDWGEGLLGLIPWLLSCCSGEVERGFNSPCSPSVLSAIKLMRSEISLIFVFILLSRLIFQRPIVCDYLDERLSKNTVLLKKWKSHTWLSIDDAWD